MERNNSRNKDQYKTIFVVLILDQIFLENGFTFCYSKPDITSIQSSYSSRVTYPSKNNNISTNMENRSCNLGKQTWVEILKPKETQENILYFYIYNVLGGKKWDYPNDNQLKFNLLAWYYFWRSTKYIDHNMFYICNYIELFYFPKIVTWKDRKKVKKEKKL